MMSASRLKSRSPRADSACLLRGPPEVVNTQSIEETLLTPRDFIRWGVSLLTKAEAQGLLYFGHGTDNAVDESVRLVLQGLHLPSDAPDTLLDGRLLPTERHHLTALFVRRVEERIPLPYLTHQALFAGLEFHVDQRVLVPRSPIAELIEAQFTPWVDPQDVENVLEIGTGSACIAIASAYVFPDAVVDAVDLSEDALEVAQINIEQHGVGDRVHAIRSDLFSALEGRRYGLIVTNPPYVDHQDLASMPAEFHAEPRMGLEAGEDGLDLVVQILLDSPAHLEENGVLICEVGNSAEALEQIFPEVPWIWIEFEHGGHGVFVIDRDMLQAYHSQFRMERERRGREQAEER